MRVFNERSRRIWWQRPTACKAGPIYTLICDKVLTRKCSFRWVALQLDSLQHCQDPATLCRELNALPDDLANTYAAILKRIPKRSEEQSIRLLQFLAFSERPLRLKEVVDLLAVDLKEKPMFNPDNRMPIPEEIAGYCSGLVVIGYADDDQRYMEIQLAHATVKEYLISDRLSQDVSAHFAKSLANAATSITEVCLAYLADVKLSLPPNIEDEGSAYSHGLQPSRHDYKYYQGLEIHDNVRWRYPFAQYAAEYWTKHAFYADPSRVDNLFEKFVDCEIFHELYEISSTSFSALYLMVTRGLIWAVELLLKKSPALINSPNHQRRLTRAVESLLEKQAVFIDTQKHQREPTRVESLLNRSTALIDIQNHRSLLAESIRGYHDDIFYLLLDRGAEVDRAAVICASARGAKELIELLIGKVTDTRSWCDDAAEFACEEGHLEILQMILKKCEETNTTCRITGEGLSKAFERGHISVVRTLLDKPPYKSFYTQCLMSASLHGLYQLVKVILAEDTDANAVTNDVIYRATEKGDIGIVKLLLNHGTVTEESVFLAAHEGHKEILQLLLENGGNPNARERSNGDTALQTACYHGHKDIVEILLGLGATDKVPIGIYGTAFQSSVRGGNLEIAELLMDRGEARSGFDIKGVSEQRLLEGPLKRLKGRKKREQ